MTAELSRRHLLAGSAALAAGSLLPEAAVSSQAAAAAPAAEKPVLALSPLELKLTHPWTLSRGSSTEKKNGLLTLTADGVTGFGEAAANVRYTQSWESGEAAFARVKKAVEGLSPWEHLAWLERAEKEAGRGVEHPPLLVLGQKIIHQRHDKPEHNGQEPRPEDREAEPC